MKILRRDFAKSSVSVCVVPLLSRFLPFIKPHIEWQWSVRSVSGFWSMEGYLKEPQPRSLLMSMFPSKDDPRGSIMAVVNKTEFLGCPPESLLLDRLYSHKVIDDDPDPDPMCYLLARLNTWRVVNHHCTNCGKTTYQKDVWLKYLPQIRKEHCNAGNLVDFHQLFYKSARDRLPRSERNYWGDFDPQIQGEERQNRGDAVLDHNGCVIKVVMLFNGVGKCINCDCNEDQPVVFNAMIGTRSCEMALPRTLDRSCKTRTLCRKCGHYIEAYRADSFRNTLSVLEHPWNLRAIQL